MLVDAIKLARCAKCGEVLYLPLPYVRTKPGQMTTILTKHKQECKGRKHDAKGRPGMS